MQKLRKILSMKFFKESKFQYKNQIYEIFLRNSLNSQ